MKSKLPTDLEAGRVLRGPYGSDESDGAAGAFFIKGPRGRKLKIMSSGPDEESGWEHVSISTEREVPNWEEMCFVKNLFWDEEECVMQLHPPKSQYVNFHPYCLHLWRPLNGNIPMPDPSLVGPVGV
jgi:hypothetical protein